MDPPTTACDTVRPALAAYVDGALARDARTVVEAHVVVCGPCASALAHGRAYARTMVRVRAGTSSAPDALRTRVRELIGRDDAGVVR